MSMIRTNINRSYQELIKFDSFDDRFDYLKLGGSVGADTFGYHRYLNQALYRSEEWKRLRRAIIIRDNGCDLGLDGYEINNNILIHHINPITMDNIKNRDHIVFDVNNLICVSHETHNAIHYSDENLLFKTPVERMPNDTCPWKP